MVAGSKIIMITVDTEPIPCSGKLLREKTFANMIFTEKNFADCSLVPCQKMPHP